MRTRVLLMALAMTCGTVWAQAPKATQPTPVGDFHQHVFSDEIVKLAGPESGLQPLPAKELIALLDAAGIRKAVLLSTAYLYGSPKRKVENEYVRARHENDWTAAQAAQFPDRLVALCGIAPLREYALAEIRLTRGRRSGACR